MVEFKTMVAAGFAALLLGAAAAPAAAQDYRGERRGYDNAYRNDAYRNDARGEANYRGARNLNSSYVDSLEWRITNAAQERRLSWGQARQLTQELRQIQGPMIYRVENGRASDWEFRRVNNVVNRIEAATRGYARNDRRDRYDRDD